MKEKFKKKENKTFKIKKYKIIILEEKIFQEKEGRKVKENIPKELK